MFESYTSYALGAIIAGLLFLIVGIYIITVTSLSVSSDAKVLSIAKILFSSEGASSSEIVPLHSASIFGIGVDTIMLVMAATLLGGGLVYLSYHKQSTYSLM